MKKCPFCAEQIQDEAVVCPHCTRNLPALGSDAPEAQALREKEKTANGGLITVGLIALLFLLLILARSR